MSGSEYEPSEDLSKSEAEFTEYSGYDSAGSLCDFVVDDLDPAESGSILHLGTPELSDGSALGRDDLPDNLAHSFHSPDSEQKTEHLNRSATYQDDSNQAHSLDSSDSERKTEYLNCSATWKDDHNQARSFDGLRFRINLNTTTNTAMFQLSRSI
ncbi:hypothetical protein TrVFT333_000072 [Trichoderma virens FT-333]|nr:hypothetical protein TrVFT333_000072 [Trichoderma virens FT-333]